MHAAASTLAGRGSRRPGFTLVLTMIILAAITLLVLGLFANVSSESVTSANYDNAFRAQTAVRSGLSRVEALLQRGTWSDDYLVLEHLQNPPLAGATPTEVQWRNRKPVLTLARAKVTSSSDAATANSYTASWEYIPLTSGVAAPVPTNATPALPVTALTASSDPNTGAPNQVAIGLPKRQPWQAAQDSYWEVIYEDEDTDGDPQTPASKVPVARYCFQVEDLQGLLSLDHAGNPGDDVEGATGMLSRSHERERFQIFESAAAAAAVPRNWYAGLAPGMRTPDDNPLTDDRRWVMSQAALYSLIDPLAVADTGTIDNQILIARQTRRTGETPLVASLLLSPDSWKPVLMKEDITNPWPLWLKRKPLAKTADGTAVSDVDAGRFPDSAARRLEENTITGLRPYYEYPLIPAEPGVFAQPRTPKMNLNRLLTQVEDGTITHEEAVLAITDHIKKHLPDFETRAGGLPVSSGVATRPAYLMNLAAGIIDYADTDCVPTIDPLTAGADADQGSYRGCDSYPLVNEQFLVNEWKGSRKVGTRWELRFAVTFYYEMWNMTNRPVTGSFQAEYSNKAVVKAGPSTPHDLSASFEKIELGSPQPVPDSDTGVYWMDLYEGSGGVANVASPIITILPNEHKVLGTETIIFALDAGSATLIPTEPKPELEADMLSHYRIRFKPAAGEAQNPLLFGNPAPEQDETASASPWVVIDRTRAKLDRKGRGFSSSSFASSCTMAVSSCNISNGGTLGNFVNNTGDPRGGFYMPDSVFLSAVSYTSGASPGGRNYRPSISNTLFYKEVFPSKWADRGHDSMPYGASPSSDSVTPFMVQPAFPPATQPEVRKAIMRQAPQRISNVGRFFSATELGNIYDPLFWDPNGGATNPDSSTQDAAFRFFWDIGPGAGPSPYTTGGNTLRIGRPEHSRFRSNTVLGAVSNRRLSASSLLDLFHCGIPLVGGLKEPVNGENNRRDLTGPLTEIRGQVNLNTASKDTLRSLVTGMLSSDPAMTPSTINITKSTTEADGLVDAILRARPFSSPAQLPEKVRTTTGQPILGNADFYTGISMNNGLSKWGDTAAEELFARLYNSTTVRSRHFRIYVTGQAIKARRSDSTQMEVLSTRSRVFHVFVRPIRDPATGLINDQRVETIYEQDL